MTSDYSVLIFLFLELDSLMQRNENGCHPIKTGPQFGPYIFAVPHSRSVPLSGLNSPFAIGLATFAGQID